MLKPIFCIDATENKNNLIQNGSEFITATVAESKTSELEEKEEELQEAADKAKLPLWLRVIKYICGFFFGIVLLAVVRNLGKLTFAEMFNNAPILFIAAFVCAAAWLCLTVCAKTKENKTLKEQDVEQIAYEMDSAVKTIFEELKVPYNAVDIDVLVFRYKVKDGKVRPISYLFQNTPYVNVALKAYVSDGYLYLADLQNLYSFKLSELISITTVNKRISISQWNKDVDPKHERFKQYKLRVNDNSGIFLKPYYILEGEHNGERFGIYFPSYELDNIEILTKLRADG